MTDLETLAENLRKLEELTKKKSFILKEIKYLIGG